MASALKHGTKKCIVAQCHFNKSFVESCINNYCLTCSKCFSSHAVLQTVMCTLGASVPEADLGAPWIHGCPNRCTLGAPMNLSPSRVPPVVTAPHFLQPNVSSTGLGIMEYREIDIIF